MKRQADELEEKDELYHKAVKYAESKGNISISEIQKEFLVGYNRAANIIKPMEDDGLIGPTKKESKER